MLFLGIDGGGTRCRARIRDDAGRFVGEGEGGPANIYQDLPAAATSVMAAATQASEHAGLTAEVLRQLHAGLGVAGIITADSAHRLRASGLQFASLAVALDAHAACLGAHAIAPPGNSTRVERAVLLSEPPSLDKGEVTDKGSINQRAVLAHRAALVVA